MFSDFVVRSPLPLCVLCTRAWRMNCVNALLLLLLFVSSSMLDNCTLNIVLRSVMGDGGNHIQLATSQAEINQPTAAAAAAANQQNFFL